MGKSLIVLVGDRKNKIIPDQEDLGYVSNMIENSAIAKGFDNILVYSDLLDFFVLNDKGNGSITRLKASIKQTKILNEILRTQKKNIKGKCCVIKG